MSVHVLLTLLNGLKEIKCSTAEHFIAFPQLI